MYRKLFKVINCTMNEPSFKGEAKRECYCYIYNSNLYKCYYTNHFNCKLDLVCFDSKDIEHDFVTVEEIEPTPDLLMLLRFKGCSNIKIKVKNDKI